MNFSIEGRLAQPGPVYAAPTVTFAAGRPGSPVAILRADKMIRGYAARYLEPCIGPDGAISMFWPGCFTRSLETGATVRFLRDHDELEIIGSTVNGLELLSDDIGLAFRAAVSASHLQKIASRRAMSIGFLPIVQEVIELGAKKSKFRLIRDALLDEISILHDGCADGAFASVGDGAKWKSLRDECKDGTFAVLDVEAQIRAMRAAHHKYESVLTSIRKDLSELRDVLTRGLMRQEASYA